MGEYAEFINKYFPFSSKIENEEVIYRLICENNLISEIMLKYISLDIGCLNKEKKVFYKRFRDGINKLLMYLPLNEEIGIYACMRFSVEQFLKFVYAIYFNKNADEISRISYRHIKEDIRNNIYVPETVKSELQKVYTYYAKYSNDIHAREIDENEGLVSLGRIIRSINEYSDNIENDLRNFLDTTYVIMNRIFHIEYKMLDTSERLSIANLKSCKRKKKIYNILEYDI